jgi:hypothetical protein
VKADRGDSGSEIGLRNPRVILIPKMISAHPRQLTQGVGLLGGNTMIEVAKLLVDLFAKIFDPEYISKRKKAKALSKLGAQLFLLYLDLNSVLMCGRLILKELTHFANRSRPYDEHSGYHLKKLVRQQRENIHNVVQQMNELSTPLQIVDGQSHYKLHINMGTKESLLEEILEILDRNFLPLPLTEITLPPEKISNSKNWKESEIKIIHAGRVLDRAAISLHGPWTEETYGHIRSYLASGLPEANLTAIEGALQHLHTALKENFSIPDILLEVGEPRSERNY